MFEYKLPGELEREELDAEEGGRYGDPRRCPFHGCITSSPDGMFDAPCAGCEWDQMDDSEVQRGPVQQVQVEPVVSVWPDDDLPF